MVKKLTWDSDFFKKNIGQIDASEFKKANLLEYDLIYVTSQTDFNIVIQDFECTFEEVKVVFEKKNLTTANLDSHIFSVAEVNVNLEDLYVLAYESGKYSRFLLDYNFSKLEFETMYKMWVDNSISKKIATDVLVYIENQKLLGFVTYKIDNKNAHIGLIAVHPNAQGKGIGKKLLARAEHIAQIQHCHVMQIPTQQQNKEACTFYSKQQYNVSSETYIKHYWRK